jgi:DNA-binding transcriptional MocR family regulator
LLEKIQGGDWPAHHQLPAEQQLAHDFCVSRITANKAIRDMVQQGYLTRQPGLGTFVTDRKAESPLLDVLNMAEEGRGLGHHCSNEVLVAGHRHRYPLPEHDPPHLVRRAADQLCASDPPRQPLQAKLRGATPGLMGRPAGYCDCS